MIAVAQVAALTVEWRSSGDWSGPRRPKSICRTPRSPPGAGRPVAVLCAPRHDWHRAAADAHGSAPSAFASSKPTSTCRHRKRHNQGRETSSV